MPEEGQIYVPSESGGALRQGEILSDLIQRKVVPSPPASGATPIVEEATHPYAIVLSQDCDLDWDFKARGGHAPEQKVLPSILFCEVTDARTLRGRTDVNSTIWAAIKTNSNERYQVLSAVAPGDDTPHDGLPELAIDFKRYFTIPTNEVYAQLRSGTQRRARLTTPYREHLCARFSYFQSRVALPTEHEIAT